MKSFGLPKYMKERITRSNRGLKTWHSFDIIIDKVSYDIYDECDHGRCWDKHLIVLLCEKFEYYVEDPSNYEYMSTRDIEYNEKEILFLNELREIGEESIDKEYDIEKQFELIHQLTKKHEKSLVINVTENTKHKKSWGDENE